TTFSGTSAACPLTAALAGLVVSLHPDWNSTDVMKKICYACEEVGDYTYELGTLYPYGKWNEEMGYGRINAHYALQGGSVSFEPPSNFTSSVNGNHVLLEWDLPSGGSTNEEWLKYHDGSFEDSFASTNGGMGIAQRFTAPAAYLKLNKIRYYTSNFQNYDSYNEIFVLSGNGSEVLAGPYYRQGKANGWISLDLSDIIINASSFMVATYNTDPNGPFVGADNSHYNGSLYFGNHTEGFDELGVLGYQYVGSHEAYVEYSAKSGEVIKSILKPTAQQVTANKLQRSGGFINYRLEKNIHPKKTGARNLLGYNVFRNGDEINQEIITETTYQDNALNAGNYSYSITAVYDEGESRHSDTLEVTIQQGDFTPPTSLVAFNNNENVELYWKSPGGFGGVEWIAYHDNSFENSICSVNGNMGLAQNFHLDYHPANLKAVRFFVENYGNWDGEIEVYILRSSGNNVIAGPYVVDGEAGGWITIENEGVTINEASFMVATYNTEPNGPYISTDMNNYKASLYFGNHYEGFMELGQDEFFAVGSHEALVEYLNKDGNVITEVIGWKPGETVKTVQAERSLEHYSVYRDQQFLTTTNTTHAEDILPAFGTYEYSVTASYEEGESEATGSVAVTWESGYGIDENEISLNTSLFPNPGKDIFYMKSYQEITMIRILDVSGKIIYRMQLQEREAMLDLSMLKAGVYFLYFQSEEETGIKKLIVK
ncbi:MAG: T9SS type A sorting domain-containing protein, partial [Bacteroidales bacterium]|nr:T9SS type A sorting domain-containing protein [Bacteroidales bacterium]